MNRVVRFSLELRDVIVALVRLQRLDDRRWPLKGPRRPWIDTPRVRPEEAAAVAHRIGLRPPEELLALAALEIPLASDYGLCGVGNLGVSDLLAGQPAWESWHEVTALAPFGLLEGEIDGGSLLPEIVALDVSGPEDIEAPTWALALDATARTYGLIGGRRTKHDRVRLLHRGTLAEVLQFANAAQLRRLPTLAAELAAVDTGDLVVPDVVFEAAAPAPAGRTVIHPTFGRGVVLREHGAGDAQKLTVVFETAGEKVLLARFVRDA